MSLADALERAAEALPDQADAIRPANGDPHRLLETLEPAAAGRVLDWLLRNEAADADELLETWLEEDAGLAVLAQLDEAALPKPARKLLRRARHRLRSRGVALAEPEPVARVATLPAVDDALEAAFVTALDPAGARLVYLVEPDPSGGARLFEAAVDDRRGVLDASLYSANRSRVRSFLRELASPAGPAAVPVPVAALRALLARAASRHPADRRLPRDFAEWKARLLAGAESAATPGQLVAEALGETQDAAHLRAVVERVAKGELGPWPATGPTLAAVAARVRERAESPLLVSPAQRREQAEAALVEAVPELYGGPAAGICRERFQESAFVFWKRGDEEAARDCLAAAEAFATLEPADNPVARALAEAVLAPVLEATEREKPAPAEPGT